MGLGWVWKKIAIEYGLWFVGTPSFAQVNHNGRGKVAVRAQLSKHIMQVKVIFAVVKWRLKQLQRKILRLQWDSNPWPLQYWCYVLPTELCMKPHCKQVKSEFNLYLLYEY